MCSHSNIFLLVFSEEGITKSFTCARTLVGQNVFIQLVGVEGSLSLCEVEIFTTDGKLSLFSAFHILGNDE